jgi:hypothetical protein
MPRGVGAAFCNDEHAKNLLKRPPTIEVLLAESRVLFSNGEASPHPQYARAYPTI